MREGRAANNNRSMSSCSGVILTALVTGLLLTVVLSPDARAKANRSGGKRALNVAVFPVESQGIEQNLRNDVVKWITRAVNRLRGFTTRKTAEETRKLTKGVAAAFESCTEPDCAVDLGKAVKADLAILPKVTATEKGSYKLEMLLVDVRTATPVRQHVREKLAGKPGLKRAMKRAVRFLLSGNDPALKGRLMLEVSEPGASIYVDDVLVGVSPLKKYVPVADGIRRIAVKKKGFKTWKKVLPVPRGKKKLVVHLEKGTDKGKEKLAAVTELPPLVPIKKESEPPKSGKVQEQKKKPVGKETGTVKAAKKTNTGVATNTNTAPKPGPTGNKAEQPAEKKAEPAIPALAGSGERAKPLEKQAKPEVPQPKPVRQEAAPPGILVPPPPEQAETSRSSGPPGWVKPLGYALAGAGALSLIGGAVYTSKGMAASDDGSSSSVHNKLGAQSFKDDASDYGTAATVFWSLSGAFMASGVGLVLWDVFTGGTKTSASAESPKALPSAAVTVQGVSVGISGTW